MSSNGFSVVTSLPCLRLNTSVSSIKAWERTAGMIANRRNPTGPTIPVFPMAKALATLLSSSNNFPALQTCGLLVVMTPCPRTNGRTLTPCLATPSGMGCSAGCTVNTHCYIQQGQERRRPQHDLCAVVLLCQPGPSRKLRPVHQLLQVYVDPPGPGLPQLHLVRLTEEAQNLTVHQLPTG